MKRRDCLTHVLSVRAEADAETGDPLPAFTVTPGRVSTWRSGEFEWSFRAKSTHTAGSFSVSFQQTEQAPALLVEADGYFSHVSDTMIEPENDLLIEMEKGPSLSGVVLRPDGQPAAQATVNLFGYVATVVLFAKSED